MEPVEYEKMDQVEGRMWWYAALHANLLTLYGRAAPAALAALPVLDAGCGTGGLLRRFAARYPDRRIVGLDADAGACVRAAGKSAKPVCGGSINELPFGDGAFSAIISADVLGLRGVDEARAIAELRRCLAPGGVVILNLPAYRWMMSRHDVAVHNARRYTAARVAALLSASGFRPLFTGYWNGVLLPLMAAVRKLPVLRDGATSDVKLYSPPVELACRAATGVEHALLARGIAMPFGGSVLAVAARVGAAG